jgi:hypothetical protein
MGQAKERKERLGEWYGRPIGPGHPDFVPPKKREPIRPIPYSDPVQGELWIGSREFGIVRLDRHTKTGCVFVRTETTREEPTVSEPNEVPCVDESPHESPSEQPRRTVSITNRRARLFLLAAMFGAIVASGIDLGPDPEYRPKKR